MTTSVIDGEIKTGVRGVEGAPPLIAHVLFHFGVGGLENGVVNLINGMPADVFRHVIVCVRGANEFRHRLIRDDVDIITLNKREGIEAGSYIRAWRALRHLRPAIVHTRNLAALEMQLPALLAGVPCRIHSEHGREGADSRGDYGPYNLIRKTLRPAVHRYVGLSRDLQRWLIETIGIPGERVHQIYNGVDTVRFRPARARPTGLPRQLEGAQFIIGAVGRLAPVKDHLTLIRAMKLVVASEPGRRDAVRLAIIGEGPCRGDCERAIREAGLEDVVWLAGERNDVAELMQAMDVFCLTSLNEGINNTVLEAMSSALPVVATRVGGNPELVTDGVTGMLVPPGDAASLAGALQTYRRDTVLRQRHGAAGRTRVEAHFSIERMVQEYLSLYLNVLGARTTVRHA
jgi:sugar transferase (PEP-CTERM/EpsH1 system associated)